MPVAQGSSRILIDSLAPVRKLHTRGGAVGTLHPSGSNRISGVLHPGEGDRSLSGILRLGILGEENRKSNLPGLDPWTAQWLSTLLCLLSMAREMMITSLKVMSLM